MLDPYRFRFLRGSLPKFTIVVVIRWPADSCCSCWVQITSLYFFLWTFIFSFFSHKNKLTYSNPGGATTTVLRPSGFLLNVSHGIEVLTGCLSFLLNVSHGIEVWTWGLDLQNRAFCWMSRTELRLFIIFAECLARNWGCLSLLLNVSHGIEVWTCRIFILAECLARSGCFDLQNVDLCWMFRTKLSVYPSSRSQPLFF